MNNFAARLLTFGITFTIIVTLNNLMQVGESQKVDSGASFLTYNNTAYGVSINYPPNWEIYDDSEFLLSILENVSSSEQEGMSQNDEVASKVSDVLEAFGLEKVSDIFGLNPDEKSELLQKMSQALTEGTVQMFVAIASPLENESDAFIENLNIIADNSSALSSFSLDEYTNANIEGLKVLESNFTLVQPPMEITIDGKDAMTFVFTATDSADESTTLKFLDVVTINENVAYLLTFTSTPDTYPSFLPTFEKMLQSFRISN